MEVWHVRAKDEVYNKNRTDKDVYYEKRFFEERSEAAEFVLQHRNQYNPLLDSRDMNDYYTVTKVDTELVPDYRMMFIEHFRKKVKYRE